MGDIVDYTTERPPLLAGYRNAELHPSVVEALKRWTLEVEEHAYKRHALIRQYLAPLEAESPELAAQAHAVRRIMGESVPDPAPTPETPDPLEGHRSTVSWYGPESAA